MEMWEMIQNCQIKEVPVLYDKNEFLRQINQLTPDAFSRFCREYLHLRNFYDVHQDVWVADDDPFIQEHRDMFWHIGQIDFDEPVNFDIINESRR
jgi:hypothetical protein